MVHTAILLVRFVGYYVQVYKFIIADPKKGASNRLTRKEIYEHNMISLTRTKHEDTYDLRDLFKYYDFEMDKAPERYINFIKGQSYGEFPTSIWISDLIHETDLSEKFSHVSHEVGQSVDFKIKLSSLLPSLDIRPDTCLKVVVNGFNLAIFMTEMHSGIGPSSYDNTVWKTASNCVDHFRLLKMYKPEIKKVTSFVFPKLETATKVSKVEVTFSVENLKFILHIEELSLEKVKDEVSRVLSELPSLFKLKNELRHSFFF